MAIFDRRKKEEEDEEEIPSKKFRDLNPENRKRRKEPPKLWGRRERLLVLLILVSTILTSSVLAISARDWKLPGLPRIKISPFVLKGLFGGETIVIEKDKRLKPKDKEKEDKIIFSFKDATKNLSGTYGLDVVSLDDGSVYGVDEKEIFQAASLMKLPVLATLYKDAEKGEMSLETKYALKNSDKISGAGSLSGKPAGTVLTYRDLARLMGKQSDNTAYGIIRRILGEEKIKKVIAEIGMADTSLDENKTTPYDVGVFFKRLWKEEVVSRKARDEILGYLTETIYENWLVAGIPKGVRVAHKYGREIHVVNDAGIVFAQKPFVLVIMSEGVVESEADKVFPELAKIVYEIEIE